MDSQQTQYQKDMEHWLDQIVIGLNLCPFAKAPRNNGQIRIEYCLETEPELILECIRKELIHMEETKPATLETTLIAVPNAFQEFDEYNQFLDFCEYLVHDLDLTGVIQVASFHPRYQFADTQVEDPENFTNRAPYPVFHLIREDSITKAVDNHPAPEQIPMDNIKKMNEMSDQQRKDLFYYLFK